MFKETESAATYQFIIEKLETALVEYAAKYGLTDNAREALRISVARAPSKSTDMLD